MNIKSRLTIQIGSISTAILAVALITIYLLSESYREEEYYERLISRSVGIAKLLIEIDEIDENLLYRMEHDSPVRLPEEAIQIFNFKNESIFQMDDDGVLQNDSLFIKQIRLDSMITFRSGEREHIGLLFTSRFDRFVISASAVDIYGHRKIKNLRNILLTVFGVGALITFLTARFYAQQAMRPVERLIQQVEVLSPANLSKRLEEASGSDEIGLIAKAFNEMLDRVEKAFKTQKNFIANASHEMRTPLTAISGQLEVLSLKERSTDEYKDTLHSVIGDMQSLNRLANRLLLLAQTETDAAEADFAPCRIDDVIWQAAADIRKQRDENSVTIQMDSKIEDENQLIVNGSELLLRTVIINLLENACKYSDNHSVRLEIKSESGYLILVFVDEGIGIPAADRATIFNPFFRGGNVAQRPGHGIGLSLVKRIVDMHHGSIELQSIENEGTTFKVSLPLAF